MPQLSKERIGEIAILFILKKRELEGVTLNPSNTRREVHNEAKRLGIDTSEMAECMKIIYQHIFEKTMEELASIIKKGE